MKDTIYRQDAIDALWEVKVSPDGEIFNAIKRAQQSLIEALPSAQPQRWIPCSEKMPKEYTRVIGYMAWHAMTAIEYQHGRWYSIDHLEPLPDEAVSHWMPLPKPPKEGTK